MALISRRSIDDLRQRADIVALAGDYTQMKQRGRDWWGLSPFKSEKSPSFKVNPETGLWYCFSTQQGGDVFKLVTAREGLDFPEAVERVAMRFGVELEYEQSSQTTEGRSLRSQLLEIHQLIADYWHRCFLEDAQHSEWMKNYWIEKRKFNLSVAEDFGIGFAPIDDSKLIPGLLKKNFTKEAIAGTGLFFGVDKQPDPIRWRCRFRGRLVIPIRDIQGRVIAFTARTLDITPQDDPSREAKYVNSPETDLFKKSRTVFNLDRARANRKDEEPFVLVEGQLDAIRCHTVGIHGVIAAQGTAVTEEHLAQLRRFTKQLVVFLDSDAAGQKAALRLLPIGLREGLDIRFLSLPGGKDPDEYFSTHSIESWPDLLKTARTAMRFCVQSIIPEGSTTSPLAQRLSLLESIFPIVEQAGAEEIVREALNEAARHAGIGIREMHMAYERHLANSASRRPAAQLATAEPVEVPVVKGGGLTTPEEDLIHVLLRHEQYFIPVSEALPLEWIDVSYRGGSLLLALLNEAVNGHFKGIREAVNVLDPELQSEAAKLTSHQTQDQDQEGELKSRINSILKAFHQRRIQFQNRQIDAQIASTASTEVEKLNSLLAEKIKLRKESQTPPSLPK
ncbi:MAG: DNA primase [Opitutales bacterium]|nr:DNA primase [Opitutales bacterium]